MNVRLETWEIEKIIESFAEYFEENDHLWLFGSRLHFNKRGGDIDLYIEVQHYEAQHVLKAKNCFWHKLQEQLGEQKIDIVIRDPNQALFICHVARREGVRLI
jgi:hypothetical protein